MNISEISGKKNARAFAQFVGESLAGCWVVALLGFSGYVLHFNSAPVGFLFLLVVVTEAILCGFWQATVVSIVACACLDYLFYPPVLVLTIADPQDWVALGAFEFSALIVSRLSSKERRNWLEANLQRTSMEQLYELSRSALLINIHQAPGPQLTGLIQRTMAEQAVAIFDANASSTDRCGLWTEDEANLARQCFFLKEDDNDPATQTSRRLLRVGSTCIGAMVVRGNLSPLVTNALASLAASTLDRCIRLEKENRIEAAHQSERLRAAVLDSLAHAVKTPLTAIQTANSGLREVGELNEPQESLVSLIEGEASHLSDLCTRLLQTARLEAEEVSLGKEVIPVTSLVSKAVQEQSGRMAGHPVEVAVADPGLCVRGDSELLSMALVQYLDNAAKYSFSGTGVKIAAWGNSEEVLISVHNIGPAIPITDRERIFQRVYRSEGSKHLADGTGIGLSAVKMTAEAHRGHVWVISDANEGTTFFLSLPQDGRRPE
jgi:two-component system sensor histidine kinase KdpD